ncbi:unnamed protein product [Schistosoma rodhaini]|uniref:Ovule protein n=1 Tax=Schistosoma mansoni TaxID=6183 RepID=A0A5K4F5N6_SCHMA|nr:unnamed protein product [Schistosoma rodhaini]
MFIRSLNFVISKHYQGEQSNSLKLAFLAGRLYIHHIVRRKASSTKCFKSLIEYLIFANVIHVRMYANLPFCFCDHCVL